MFGADNRLSLAASAIWRQTEAEAADYDLDGSGELGGVIAHAHQRNRVDIVGSFGFTPAEYNGELRRRMCGDEYPGMSHHVYNLLTVLEVEDMDEWWDHETLVYTVGREGHPGAEQSTLAYLKEQS